MRLVLTGLKTTKGKDFQVQLEDGVIVGFDNQGDEVIDFNNQIILRGLVDMKATMCTPGYEHKETLQTGLAAAAKGGFTTVCQTPDVQPVLDSASSIEYYQTKTANSLVDIKPIAALTKGLKGEELSEIIDLTNSGAVAFSHGHSNIEHTGVLLHGLEYIEPQDGLIISNPYDKYLVSTGLMHEGIQSTTLGLKGIPSLSETIAIHKNVEVLDYIGGRLHISGISCKESVDLIKAAKEKGLSITCDVHYINLLFNDSALATFDSNYKVFPPLRLEKDRLALIEAVKDGTIDVIVSNHQPHEEDAKKLEFNYADFGVEAFETVLNGLLTYTDLTLDQIEKALAINPTDILKLEKNDFEIGQVFNATIFDNNSSQEIKKSDILSQSKNNPLIGQTLKGKVSAVFNKNQKTIFS